MNPTRLCFKSLYSWFLVILTGCFRTSASLNSEKFFVFLSFITKGITSSPDVSVITVSSTELVSRIFYFFVCFYLKVLFCQTFKRHTNLSNIFSTYRITFARVLKLFGYHKKPVHIVESRPYPCFSSKFLRKFNQFLNFYFI